MKPFPALVRSVAFAIALAGFVGCDNPASPRTSGIDGSAGALSTKSDASDPCPGQSGGDCQMAVSLLLDAASQGTLIVRTGTYDQATGLQTSNGTFSKVQWKVYDAKGKLVQTRNDNASGTIFIASIPTSIKMPYTVDVQANIDNQSGKRGTAVVRGTGTPAYLPDINLSTATISLLVDGVRHPLAQVSANTPNTYVVDIANLTTLGGVASTSGIGVICVVAVDGTVQVPVITPGFSYSGSPTFFIAPGATKPCAFTLSLPPGAHTIKVTAVAADMLLTDIDTSNNSTTATVITGSPADVSLSRVERIATGGATVPGPAFGAVTVATTQTFSIWATAPANSLPADVTCSASIVGADPSTYTLTWITQTVHLASDTKECRFTLTPQNPGTLTINTSVASAGDPTPANNSASGTLTVNPNIAPNVTTDLVVRPITPIAPIVSGSGNVTYSVPVGVLAGGSNTTANFTCAVVVTRQSGIGAAAGIVMLPVTGPASTTTDGQCRFTLTGLSDNAGQNETYAIKVTATPTDANELAPANNSVTANQLVQPKLIDVVVRSLEQDTGAGRLPLGRITAGSVAQYVATIGVDAGGVSSSSPVTCSAKATNIRTNVVTSFPTTVTGTPAIGTDALCRFSATLASNGDADEAYSIEVTATPTGATDITPSNNTRVATQTAIVRVDVSVVGVTMTVDNVVQGILSTISKGKIANYTATFLNGSSRAATISCAVNAAPGAGLSLPITVLTPGPITVPAGGTNTCRFDYAFPELVAVNFVVTAANVSPIDQDLDNNAYAFQTVSQSDHTFPAITAANVAAHQQWVTDALGNPTVLNDQSASLNRITLTFAEATDIIGDFKLTGILTTGGRPFSSATWTVHDLRPGLGGQASCVVGVDPGATSVNGQTISLSICAQEVPGQPGVQAIFVEYNSSLPHPVNNPDPLTLYGPELTFNVTLDWTLHGATISDRASALLQFNLNQVSTGFANSWVKDQTGLVTVIRNGGG